MREEEGSFGWIFFVYFTLYPLSLSLSLPLSLPLPLSLSLFLFLHLLMSFVLRSECRLSDVDVGLFCS